MSQVKKSIEIGYDWCMAGTKERLEEQMTGFVFKGVGWYETEKEIMLVVELQYETDRYIAYIFSNMNVRTDFKRVGEMPIHK